MAKTKRQLQVKTPSGPVGLVVGTTGPIADQLHLASSQSAYVRALIELDHGAMLEQWEWLRRAYSAELIERLIELALGPADEGLNDLSLLGTNEQGTLLRLVAVIRRLGAEDDPERVTRYLVGLEARKGGE